MTKSSKKADEKQNPDPKKKKTFIKAFMENNDNNFEFMDWIINLNLNSFIGIFKIEFA